MRDSIIKDIFFLTYTSRIHLYSVVSNNNKALSEYSRNVGEVSKIIVTAHRIFGSVIPYVILIFFIYNFILSKIAKNLYSRVNGARTNTFTRWLRQSVLQVPREWLYLRAFPEL